MSLVTRATIEGSDKFGTGQNGAKYRIKILSRPKPFISRWTTNVGSGGSNTDQVQLPLISGKTYNMVVDWGDGTSDTITAYNQAETLHTYASVGTYTITMTGTNGGLRFDNGGDKAKINQISQWGTLDISINSAFFGCANLDVTATDAPKISATNLTNTFRDCTSLTGGCDNWDVSNVTNFSAMFRGCTDFNGDVSNWNIESATNLAFVFHSCTNFNQPIGKWNVTSNVTNIEAIVINCTSFNQNLGDWDVSGCTKLNNVFNGTDFDVSFVSNWNVSSACTTLNRMFRDIGDNIGTTDINHWDVSGVTDFAQVFLNCNFNGDITGWDVSSGQRFLGMFQHSDFNQDIGSWDVSGANNSNDFSNMFLGSPFNQDIGGWDMSNATNISSMLRTVTFNQDISSWDITSITSMTNLMFQNTAFSTANYDALLVAWEAQVPQSNINVNFGNAQYTLGSAAETARTSLINTYNWTINDGGGV